MEELLGLMKKLCISTEYLVITDEITGAGYIANGDIVFARWGYIGEGIAILSAYVSMLSKPNV